MNEQNEEKKDAVVNLFCILINFSIYFVSTDTDRRDVLLILAAQLFSFFSPKMMYLNSKL